MLQSMRQLAHSWLAKGVMLFLMVSFSVWGIGDIFRGNPLQKTVAKVGDDTISVQELDRSFSVALAEARQRVPNLTPEDAKTLGLLDKTLEADVRRHLVDEEVKRQGIEVPESTIIEFLSEQPNLRNKDGSFNKDLFERGLEQEGMTEKSFMAQQKINMARQTLALALSGSHYVPQAAIDTLYNARAQKRILDIVTIDSGKMTGIAVPDDKTLRSFYDANPTLFTAPEYRNLTIASLSTDSVAKDITISDEQVQKEYDAKKDQLAHPEQRDILQVVVPDEEKAKQLAGHAFVSHDLAAAAKEDNLVAIPLTDMQQDNLMPALAKVVFDLKEGEVSDPVKTQLGWHVVQLKKISPSGTPSFAEAKDKLRDDMRRDQAADAAAHIVNQLDDQLAAGHSLDDIADELKLRIIKVAKVDSRGLMPDGKAPDEFPNKDTVLKDGFAQNSGETSPVIDDKAGNYYVVRTDDITPAGVMPFDNVKQQATQAWTAQEQSTKAKAEAGKIAQGLKDGKSLQSFADEEGASVREAKPISQLGDVDPSLPRDIVVQAFSIKKGETAQAELNGKEIVARLSQIIDADPKADDPRKNRIEGDFKSRSAEELFTQYLDYLHQVFPVTIHTDVLNQVSQQGGG